MRMRENVGGLDLKVGGVEGDNLGVVVVDAEVVVVVAPGLVLALSKFSPSMPEKKGYS